MSKFPIALALVSLLAACSQTEDGGNNKRKDRAERRAERNERGDRGARGDRKGNIAAQDKDGDGVITRAEFSGKDRRFKRLDTNGDGNLNAGEF